MRIRVTFNKTEAMRYTGHLDVQRAWERALRRANLPLSYSQGFKPHPKINLAAPLPLGYTSIGEMIDIWLDEHFTLETLKSRISAALPPGLKITALSEGEIYGPKLPSLVEGAIYTITLIENIRDLKARVDTFLSKDSIIRERRKKNYDLRPLVHSLSIPIDNANQEQRLSVELSAKPGATGRPDEVLYALGLDPYDAKIERTTLLLKDE
ncbi:MAG: TIGR03936 family radical SAM-associated protein [Chloroflexota bacterium]